MPTLQQRRLRGDLIETYKILHGLEGSDYTKFFKLRKGITRGHDWKLEKKEHISCKVREGWFASRVIKPWDNLPKSVVIADTIATFKTKLDEYLNFY